VDALTSGRAQYVAAQHPALHPGQSAEVMLDGKSIGFIGKLHPKWQQHYQLPQGVMLFELDLSPLQASCVARYQEVTKFPPIRRDMAVLVEDKVSVGELLAVMHQAKVPFVTEIALFDVYRGKGIPENQKSLAFMVMMQDNQKSLVDADADNVMASLLDLIQKSHGAALR
jgi:phenylalanyl-tRNA synthetase beta chain